jgi:tetratricopeptide (TPR) repeat protein
MQVLVALADADGAVLTREDLIRSCWKGRVVGDDSINRAIAEVRRIAREAGGGFAIETIPRIGFRLTQNAPSPPTDDPVSPAANVESGRSGVSRRWMVGGALVAAAGAGYWRFWSPPADPAEPLIAESRAVMLSGSPLADRKAIALLEQAITKSPNNPEPWGLLALSRARADEHAIDKTISPTASVVETARRALDLDPQNADAKAALAIAIPYYGDWLAAHRRFDAVLAEHPEHLFTRDSRSFFLGAVGRMRESATDRLAFAGAAPLDAGMQFRQVYAFWFLDRVAEADRAAARGLEMWPRHPGLWFARLWVMAGTGRFERALAQVEDRAAQPKLPLTMISTLRAAIGAAATKDRSAVEAATKQVLDGVRTSVAGVVNAMMLLNLMSATDAAFDVAQAYYLEEGPIIAEMSWRPGQPIVPDQRRRKTNMLFTPVAASMQQDQRFLPLVRRMGLVDYWNRRGVKPDFLNAATN